MLHPLRTVPQNVLFWLIAPGSRAWLGSRCKGSSPFRRGRINWCRIAPAGIHATGAAWVGITVTNQSAEALIECTDHTGRGSALSLARSILDGALAVRPLPVQVSGPGGVEMTTLLVADRRPGRRSG